MCGIAGFVGGDWSSAERVRITLSRMNGCLRHRGPDRSASWLDAQARVAFAHNRLSIVDLSAAGNQPMESRSGRFVIIYNGEIYNHLEMRAELGVADEARNWTSRRRWSSPATGSARSPSITAAVAAGRSCSAPS